ncbi:MAG: cadherin domain-containing protein [Proteobacteria bacterium]|nr:cadherin domain-containing protein [Pseudomonadota bacterium]
MTRIINGIVTGTAGDDVIDLANYLNSPAQAGTEMRSDGGNGDDRIEGTALNDLMNGGAGNDTLNGGDGNNNIDGGDGNDTIWVTGGNNWLSGGNGNDVVTGAAGNDHLFGDAGNDTLKGGAGVDTLDGGAGNDVFLLTGDANDPAFSHSGGGTSYYRGTSSGQDDLYVGDEGLDTLRAESANLTLVLKEAAHLKQDGIETLAGAAGGGFRVAVTGEGPQDFTAIRLDEVMLDFGDGDDIITGSSANQLVDTDGNGTGDTSNLATGNDVIEGGTGLDTVRYNANFDPARYSISLVENGRIRVQDTYAADGDTGTDILTGIERIAFNDRVFSFLPASVQDDDAANGHDGIVSENAVNGAGVGVDLSTVVSPDLLGIAPGATASYRLTNDAGGRFVIDPATGRVSVANADLLDYETTPEINGGPDRGFPIVVEVDTGGFKLQKTVTILISDGNDRPDAISDADTNFDYVMEGVPTGTLVGLTAQAEDSNPGDTFTYSLVDNAGGRFQIDPATGVVSVLNGALLDYETASSHNIKIRATDSGGLFKDQVYTIYLADFVDDSIVDSDWSTPEWVREGAANGTYTGVTASAVSAIGGTMTYSLTDNAGGRFQIDPATGRITVLDGTKLDYESNQWWDVKVRAFDGAVATEQVFTIYLEDFTEDSITDSDWSTPEWVREGAANGTYAGVTASAVSATGRPMVYSLVDDAGGRFQIDAATGRITVLDGTKLDYESQPSWDVRVRASDGLTITEQVFSINLEDFSEDSIVDSDWSTPESVREGAASGTYTGVTASAVSATGRPVVYSLVDDADGRFQIDPATGRITVLDGTKLDYESQPSWDVRVRASDGLTITEQVFSINLEDFSEDIPVDSDATVENGVDENAAAGAYTGITANAVSALGRAMTYSLIADAEGRFQIDAVTGRVTVRDGTRLDHEAQQYLEITVRAWDGVTYADQSFRIDIRDVALESWRGTTGRDTYTVTGLGEWTLDGLAGNDVLTGNDGANVTFIGGTGNDTLTGRNGNDVFRYTGGSGGMDIVDGGAGYDVIEATANNTTIGLASIADIEKITSGGFANVRLQLGNGDDVIDSNAIVLEGIAVIRAGAGNDTIIGTAANDSLVGEDGNDTLYGGNGNNHLNGGRGDDTIVGGDGYDWIEGGAGADRIDGGGTHGHILFAGSLAGVNVNLTTGTGSGADAQGDTYVNVQHVNGSAFGDILTGDGGANTLSGERGDDTLMGLGGDDTLNGGDGNDRLEGGSGNNRLNGGNGDDVIIGGNGNDWIEGGAGADRIDGGGTHGHILFAGSLAGVNVNLATGTGSGGDAQGDTYVNVQHVDGSAFGDILTGDGGANTLFGLGGNDVIHGGGGDDRLAGGNGADQMRGDAGHDVFDFNAIGESNVGALSDIILDFTRGQDKIDVTTIDANAGLAGNQNFAFVGTGAFTGTAGQLRYDTTAGDGFTHIFGDVNGDGVADFEIRLQGNYTLTATDFIL